METSIEDRLDRIEDRLERIESLLASLVERQTIKEFYTPGEFAKLVGKEELTCREYCRLGRLSAVKKDAGRGKHAAWAIPHAELARYQRHGLLPDRRRQSYTAETA
ncbi:MAG: hypothetical protein P4L85_19585 [Paludisphaera borealis]|uniref:hypothetical protein n=1 Tax=Paludisphaera borealis TaxID=1387353 RepID=UPI0028487F1C|nr:hypothetical protein [Paludisphaera borealis]MDR3621563.1 hypothetical protein [Paludisphaera borealis]